MGKIVKVKDFCSQKEAGNPFYTRALVFSHDSTVRCYSGKKVVLKWRCEDSNDIYCQDKEIGCYYFKENLAARLSLSHASIIETKKQKTLNCHFHKGEKHISLREL